MPTGRPRVAVIGPGAIGTAIAAVLHEQDQTPMLVGRSAREELRLDTEQGPIIVPGPVLTDLSTTTGPVDVVFLTVKTTQTADVAPWLRELCGPDTVVCVLQNGIEQVETVAPLIPGSIVLPAIVWFPAQRHPDGSVELRGEPSLTVPDLPGAAIIRDTLQGTRCALDVVPVKQFHTLAWRKLLQNAVAGLMALTGRRAGMFVREDISALALSYLEECLAVARADGAHLDDDEPLRLLQKFQAFPSDMGTSILTDRENRRPLEWVARNDVIRRRGRMSGVTTPLSDLLVPLLAAASDGPG